MRLPHVLVTMIDGDRDFAAEFNTSKYLTKEAAVLRAKADYAINILRGHREVLDHLVSMGAEAFARGIRNEERAGKE